MKIKMSNAYSNVNAPFINILLNQIISNMKRQSIQAVLTVKIPQKNIDIKESVLKIKQKTLASL